MEADANPIQDGHFWSYSRMKVGTKRPPPSSPYNLSHLSYNDETWHSCTLSKEDLEIL